MATQADINEHDQLITRLAETVGIGIQTILPTILLDLADIDLTDRTAIANVFEPIKIFVNENIQQLDELALDNLRLNDVVATSEIESTVTQLKTASSSTMDLALEAETNSIIDELTTEALLGLGVSVILSDLNNRIPSIVKRLQKSYDNTLVTFTSVLTRNLGGDRYRYTGGLIPNSRPFCTQHDGGVYSLQEINRIWSGVWQGKAPGDPFVVRGGYNCRHFFILEK